MHTLYLLCDVKDKEFPLDLENLHQGQTIWNIKIKKAHSGRQAEKNEL